MLFFILLYQGINQITLCYDIFNTSFPLVPCDIYKEEHKNLSWCYHYCRTYNEDICKNFEKINNSYLIVDDDEEYLIDNYVLSYINYYVLCNDIYIEKLVCSCNKYQLKFTCNNISSDNLEYMYNPMRYSGGKILLDLEQRIYLILNYIIILNDKSKRFQKSDSIVDNIFISFLSMIHMYQYNSDKNKIEL